MGRPNILVIDDDPAMSKSLVAFASEEGFQAIVVGGINKANGHIDRSVLYSTTFITMVRMNRKY